MPAPSRHTLISLAERSTAPFNGATVRTGRRGSWSFVLNYPVIGTSVDFVIETAPADVEGQYVQLFSRQKTSAGTETVSGSEAAIANGQQFARARVTANVGTYWLEIVGDSPWLDPNDSDDMNLLEKSLREWEDGRVRIVQQAERVILDELWGSDEWADDFDADVNDNRFLDAIKQAVADQSNHLYRLHELGKQSDPTSQVTRREAAMLADGAMDHLIHFRPESSIYWRHR